MILKTIPVWFLLTYIAAANGQDAQGCLTCNAFGRAQTPNEDFKHLDGCYEYTCTCNCDGSWDCPRELVVNTCQGECQECSAGGQTWKGGAPFDFNEGCFKYNCFCKCDGSWNCPKERTEDVCNKNLTTGCFFCDVNGTRYQGKSQFKHVNGCIEYTCACNCDGSWNCPGENAVDTCSINKESGCHYCNVYGHKYEGNSYFKHTNGCIEFDCACNCDGSWNCPGDRAVDRCRTNATTGCYYCQVDNYLYQGSSRFPLVRDCYLYQCDCACDGGWTCKDSIGQYKCDENGNVIQDCKTCNIDGNLFHGESRFFFQKGCIKYMCTCDCQGRFYCGADEARNTCDDVSIETIATLDSGFGYVSGYDASAAHSQGGAVGISVNEVDADNCLPCRVNGKSYRPNSDFDIVSGCDLVKCQCSCDGTVKCSARTPIKDCNVNQGRGQGQGIRGEGQGYGALAEKREVREDGAVNTCLECKHAGVTYESLTTFDYESDCWRYKCSCRCNGSYDCPSEDSRYICTGPVTCTKCKVSESKIFEPNTEFSLEQGCFKFDKCKCNCDGGWNCEDGEYTCERCQGCQVDGKKYRGNTTFAMTRGCDYFASCNCGCDGKWSCDADGLTDLCGKCRKCKIGDQYYDGGKSRFRAEMGCTRYRNCACGCDGTYECKQSSYTCSERSDQPVDGPCNDCVHGNRRFKPGQSFDYEDGCAQYRGCICKCGTTHCQQVINTCGECRSCEINGTEYRGGSEFALQSGCRLYKKCDCFCNSKWKCYGESAIDSCNPCRKCNVKNAIYDPFSRFTLDQNCWKYQCFCGCDGSTRCPSETVINTCNKPDACRSCEVNNNVYQGNTHFEYIMDGMTMSCRCNCDGSNVCFAEWLFERTDISISGSGIGTGGSSCFSCNIEGGSYRGNSNFSIQRSDIELNCQCYCNGGYYCFGKKVFDGGCRSCNVFGQRHLGDSSFDLIYNGLPVTCQCSCNGGYICYGFKGEVVITCLDGRCLPDTCAQCSLKGQVFNGRSRFGTYNRGSRFECTCGCDGSYYCQGSGDLGLSCVNGICKEVGCTSCNVFGESHSGDSSFEIIYRGFKGNCDCACGGSYTCYGSSKEVMLACLEDGTGCLPGTCTYCNVNGRRLAGRSTFRYDYKGIEMECNCGCDGSFFCQGQSLTELIEIACQDGACQRIGCGGCDVFGQNHPGESSFPIIYGGILLQCKCSCDGDYVCAGAAGQVIVQCADGVGCLTSTCRQCIVNGRRYDGGYTFMSSYKGVQINCTCGCDGTSYCIGISTSIEVSCIGGSCTRIGCRECVIFGNEYLGSSAIDFIYNGLPVTCTCDCNGGYICRSMKDQNPVIVCRDGSGQDCLSYQCRSCDIDGKRIEGNTKFDYLYNGIQMNCQCACDSSYYCKGLREKIELSCVGGDCSAIGCRTCPVYGQQIPGGSVFNVVYAGLLMKCQCRCDGSYECFGYEDGVSVYRCRNNRGTCFTSACKSCNYNDRNYPGGSIFTETYKGMSVSCTCGCDSSIFCTGEQSLSLICIGGFCTAEGCRSCNVYGRSYPGISSFPLVYSGYMLNCQCDCSGGYICQGEVSVECKSGRGQGCLSQTCSRCEFNGNVIEGMDTFKYKYREFDMSCTCGCDGNVYCNGVTSNIEIRCIGNNCNSIGCTRCKYMDREVAPFDMFKIVHQGVRLDCSCSCNAYRCTGGSGEVIIDCGSGDCSPAKCVQCRVDGRRYDAFQRFTSKYKDIDLECECGCDGSAYCTGSRNTEAIEVSCIGGTCAPRNCKTCSVFGQSHDYFSDFGIVYKGTALDCKCSCDSSYICRGSSGEIVINCDSFGRNCLPSVCRNCFVDGQQRTGGQMFPYVYEGIDMECKCGCDGSSFCRGKIINMTVSCIGNNCSPVGCQSCSIFGEDHSSPSSFNIIYQGTSLGCTCSCDSSYVCKGSTGEIVVECQPGKSCLPNICKNCVINGITYRSYTKFPYKYKDIDMRCECGCDGSSYCRGVSSSYEVSCIGDRCAPTLCGTCNIFGTERVGDTSFPMVYKGSELQCKCNCDTSYTCVGSTPDVESIECGINEDCFKNRCRKCRVNNQRYNGGDRFDFKWKSYDMSCVCGCDGSYFCRGQSSGIEIGCQRLKSQGCKLTGGCRSCNIFGQEYVGKTSKTFVYQGQFMTCNCNCDSSYECLSKTDEVVISCQPDQNCLRNCRSCRVDGRSYPGSSVFETVYKNKNMECTCGCDGSYYCQCKDDASEISCNSQSRCTWIGCNTCRSDNREHQAYSEFSKVYDDVQMTCQCNCDGSYKCTGRDVSITVICTGNSCSLDGCRSCIENGREYPYASQFETSKDGKRHRCRCECDGTSSCSEVKERVCTACTIDGKPYRGHTRHRVYRGSDSYICDCYCDGTHKCDLEHKGCKQCRVQGRNYDGNKQFATIMEAKRVECTCDCNGIYECRGDNIICTSSGGCQSTCAGCDIEGAKYKGGTSFTIFHRGQNTEMDCKCQCGGSYECKSESAICTHSSGCKSICTGCSIQGAIHTGGTTFKIFHRRHNIEMNCECECGGKYECNGGTIKCTSLEGCRDTCSACEIEGKSYKGDSDFKIFHRGYDINMDCNCRCGGTYECRGGSVVCTSTGCQDSCPGCLIEDNKYKGGSDFKIFHRGNNIDMNCTCQCGGSYECQGGTVICSSSGCRDTCSGCQIEGVTYKGGSTTTIYHRGQRLNMDCSCQCGGSYECRGGTFVCTQSGCQDECSGCQIEGATYRGGLTSTIYHSGHKINMECDCECGGNFECRGGTVICTQSGCQDTCSGCQIDGRTYKGDSTTTIYHRGHSLNMDCSCQCGGSYECRGGTFICTQSGCQDTCSGCQIEGATYKGGSTTTIFHRGHNMNMDCSCECGGNYECRGGTVVCRQSGCLDTCSGCRIEGRTYKGGSTSTIYHRGHTINMDCSCQCGGNYECRGGNFVCTQSGCRNTCSGCQIEGATHKGGSNFRIFHRGNNINMDCNCKCGGTYECRGGTFICTQSGCQNTCSDCQIAGATYKGGSKATIYHRGHNMNMDCSCECDGSYQCQGGTVICTQSGCQDSCSGCQIEGITYKGGSNFQILHRGNSINMDCTCQCGGSYECRGESIVCTLSGCQDTCTSCEIEGAQYKGGSSFEIFHRGYDMEMNCECKCGGSYKCKGVKYTESCIGPGCPISGCRDCDYQGRRYPGNTRFPTVVDDIPVECTCDCGGNLECKGSIINRTCSGPDCPDERCRDCNVDGRVVRSKTRFQHPQNGKVLECICNCDGRYECQDTSRICPGPRCGTLGCRRCLIDGRQYTGNTRFSVKDRAVGMVCSCYCDGSYSCTDANGVTHSCLGENCADSKCTQCRLDGISYSVDTRFRLQKNDMVMNCVCECDGAYRCFSISGSCQGEECDEFGCSSCNIDGELYKGGTEFQLKPGTICSCSCSGEFSCRTSSLSITCIGQNCGVGGCKSCNVDGQVMTGNQRFQFKKYGLFMQCVCNCDSSYICRGYQIIGNEGNVDRKCKQCEIDRRLYNGGTRFQVLINGDRQVCSCYCDGRHSCSGASKDCRECIVGGETYAANSPFTLTRGGKSIQCRCGCTGDFVCEGRKEHPATIVGCRNCYIFGSKYKGEQKFTTDVGGVRMLCECFCDGGYSCKGYRAVTDVILPAEPEPEEICNTCVVGDQEHPGKSRFAITRGCFRVTCKCDCGGGWECPMQTPEYICEDNREEIEYYSLTGSAVYANDPDNAAPATRLVTNLESASGTVFGTGACRSCFLNNQEFRGNTGFTLQDGCLRFSCSCACSGGWNCTSVEGADCSFQNPFTNPDPFKAKQCRSCTAFGGGTYPPEKRFYVSDECYRYSCMCNCDGSYECPRELTVKTCPDSANVHDASKGTCRQCSVGKENYEHNESFKLIENCKQYTCKCECDGSYYCPGSSAIQVCRSGSGSPGRLPGSGSRTVSQTGRTIVAIRPSGVGSVDGAVISKGQGGYLITGRETITRDGVVVSGSRSGVEGSRVVGGGGGGVRGSHDYRGSRVGGGEGVSKIDGGSREVGGGEGGSQVYDESRFVGRGGGGGGGGGVGGSHMYRESRVVGGGEGGSKIDGGSREVDGGEGGSQVYGGSRVVGRGGGGVGGSQMYRESRVVGGGEGGSRVDGGGVGYPDAEGGSRVEASVDLSSLLSGKGQCQGCIVDGVPLRGGRHFTYKSGCTEYFCECFCNGTYVCPEDQQTNFCDDRMRKGTPSVGCQVNNRVYKMNLFSYTSDCLQYSCRCYGDNKYKCDPKKTRKVC